MQSVADLRAELKVMRETHKDHQCVSKMKKADISNLIERMKGEQPKAELALPISKASKADKPVAEAKAKAKVSMADRMAALRALRKK